MISNYTTLLTFTKNPVNQLTLEKNQDMTMSKIEAGLRDLISTLKLTSERIKELKSDSSVMNAIPNGIDQMLNDLKEDPFLKLFNEVDNLASSINAQKGLIDPAGIIGMNNDPVLYQQRYGAALAKNYIKSNQGSVPALNFPPHLVQGTASSVTTPYNSPQQIIEGVLSIKYDNMQVPKITNENYNIVISEAFKSLDTNPKIVVAYRDAVLSYIDKAAEACNKDPIILVREAHSEFYQNIRISVLEAVVEKVTGNIVQIGNYLKTFDNGKAFDIHKPIIREFNSIQNDIPNLENARELKQYTSLAFSLEKIKKISDYLEKVIKIFEYNLSYMGTEELNLAIILGVDPNIRPTLKTHYPIQTIPTFLHKSALKGDSQTTETLLKAGANPNSIIEPMPSWFKIFRDIKCEFMGVVNWLYCVPTPKLVGKTPLLYVSEKLYEVKYSNKELEKKYLETALTIIDFRGNIFAYDYEYKSPVQYLLGYLGKQYENDEKLIKALRAKQIELSSSSEPIIADDSKEEKVETALLSNDAAEIPLLLAVYRKLANDFEKTIFPNQISLTAEKNPDSIKMIHDKTSNPVTKFDFSNLATQGQQILRADGALINVLNITTGIDLSAYSLPIEAKTGIDLALQLVKIEEFTLTSIGYKLFQTASYYASVKSMEQVKTTNVEFFVPCAYELGIGTMIGLSSASPVMGAMSGLDICLKKHGIYSHETDFGISVRYAADAASALASGVIVTMAEMNPITKFLYVVSAVSLTDTVMHNIYALYDLVGDTTGSADL